MVRAIRIPAIVALIGALAGCRTDAGIQAPARQPANMKATPAPAAGDEPVSSTMCSDSAAFVRYDWIPGNALRLLAVRLQAPELPRSLATLAGLRSGIFVDAPTRAFIGRFEAELPALRTALEALGLRLDEVVFVSTTTDLEGWALPGGCDGDGLARLAAMHGLAVRNSEAREPVDFVELPHLGYTLLRSRLGGPLWLARTEAAGGWRANLGSIVFTGFSEWLDARKVDTLRLSTSDPPPASGYGGITQRFFAITGSDLATASSHSLVAVPDRARDPKP